MVTRAKLNVVDSSAWLAYFADAANAGKFAAAIEDERRLVTPAICLLEVFKVIARQRGESDALQAIAVMQQGRVVEEGPFAALSAKPGGVLSAMLAAQQPRDP